MKKQLISLILGLTPSFYFSQIVTTYYDSSYSSNIIKTDMEIDSYDNIWIGYDGAGLGVFDGVNWDYFNKANSPIISNYINDIYIYDDIIFIATDSGISIKYQGYWESYNIQNGLLAENIYSVLFDGTNMYAIEDDTTLSVYNGSNWTHIALPVAFYTTASRPILFKTSTDTLYLSCRRLYKLSGMNIVQVGPMNNDTLYSIRSIVEDNSQNLWVGAYSGMYIINGNTIKTFEDIFPIPFNRPERIELMTKNQNGNIIFSHEKTSTSSNFYEVFSIDSQKISINVDFENISYRNNLRFDNQDKLWFAPSKECLYILDFSNYDNFGKGLTIDNAKYLDVNMVKAGYMNRGTFFWDKTGSPLYEVPKGSGKNSLFASGFWIGGIDPAGEMRIAANRYQNQNELYMQTNDSAFHGDDFFPGPLDTINASIDTSDARLYDKIWKIDCEMINEFIANFVCGNVTNGTYKIPNNIKTWPAHGNGNMSHNLAPFVDINQDGEYNPYNGDYPELKGDQMLYWIFNDCMTNHGNTGSKKMGLEVHATAYSYSFDNPPDDSIDMVNYQTFIDFEIINRSDTTYQDVYAGIWSDGDLGYYDDDYIGSHVKSNSFYFYNDIWDGDGNGNSYGEHPPVQTITFLSGPKANIDGVDNDHDYIVDEVDEELLLSRFIYFYNSGYTNPMGDPLYFNDYYNILRGKWRDSTSLTYDSTGYGGIIETSYLFPGSSDPMGWGTSGVIMPPWSELTENNCSGDRRGVGSSGPNELAPDDTLHLTVMFGWFRDTTIQILGIEPYEDEIEIVRNWYYNNNFPSTCSLINNVPQVKNERKDLSVYPNPTYNEINISGIELDKIERIEILDIAGKRMMIFNSKQKIDVKNLDNGVYILRIHNTDNSNINDIKIIKL
jgi:hypothetical protein